MEPDFGGGFDRSPGLNPRSMGVEPGHPCYSWQYRQEVARDMLHKGEALQSLLFDDLLNAVNASQHGELTGAPGYMRCSLPAAELAVVRPAHVVSMVPPFPEEVRIAEQYVARAGGRPENLIFWHFDTATGGLLNLSALLREPAGEERCRELIRYAAKNLPAEEDANHFRAARAVIEAVKGGGSLLVLPFQTRERHHEEFSAEVSRGEVVLMSASDQFVDKHDAARNLIAADPELRGVLLNPVRVVPGAPSLSTSERIRGMATAIITAALEIEERVGGSYIKLDGAGVSGLDNLAPSRHPEMYTGSPLERITALTAHMERRFGGKFELPAAVIEERVDRRHDRFGVREYVVSGVTTGDGFRPWCFVRAINNEHDVFQGVIGSTNPSRIGIAPEELHSLDQTMHRIGQAMNTAGYEFGYIAKDLMYDARSDSMKVNDHNDRRGGRSFLERMMVMFPGEVVMDKDYEFKIPAGRSPIEHAMAVTAAAVELGHFVYGTCMAYYPADKGPDQVIKLKIVSRVPDDILESGDRVIPTMAAEVRGAIAARMHDHDHQ